MKTILAEIATHPVVKAAALRLATELATGDLSQAIDKALDRAAYTIAKRIVEEKKQLQNETRNKNVTTV